MKFLACCVVPNKKLYGNCLYWLNILYWKFFHLFLKYRACREIFHCIEYIFYHTRFFSNLRLPWKTELPWKFSLYWAYFYIQDFWATCACPENRVSPESFHCIEYIFYHSGFLSNFVLALKNRVVLEFFTILNILFTFRNFQQRACACPEKERVPWIHSADYIFFIFRIFEQLALSLKNGFALEFFTVLKYFLSFRIFEQIALALKNRVVPKCFAVWNILLHTEFLSNLHALALENRVVLIFFIVFEHVFLSFRIFEQLALALINRVAKKFFAVWNILLHSEFLSKMRLP